MTQKVRDPWKAFVDSPATTGNWRRFDLPWAQVQAAAGEWRRIVRGHPRLWLCWSVNDAWCLLQQKLVREAGWTPVVGWDPMCGVGCPPLVDGALAIDFSGSLGVPSLFMHVPLELAFLWIEGKLAFWHSDLLLPRTKMQYLSRRFDALQDGEMAAVFSYGGLRNLLNVRSHRYWELCGCTTRSASQDQFDKGSGWWIHLASHPNAPKDEAEQRRRREIHVEHGVGIRYWEKRYGGKVVKISERKIAEGHFSVTTIPAYQRADTKSEEMEINFDLPAIARRFGIADLLES
ncbi:MAG TPA: hypothetical protein VKA76_00090 [Gammaproteobacteria bacterium]|nr:hypothetical protein [Gammaproteobacteria bacterium]